MTDTTAPDAPAGAAGDAVRLSSLLLAQVADLLAQLAPRQLDDLIAGRARLAIVPSAEAGGSTSAAAPMAAPRAQGPARIRRPPAPPAAIDVEALRAALLAAASREQAAARLAELGRVSVPQLRALAEALGVDGVGGRDPKATVLRKIVDQTVGFRLSARAMRGPDL
ncbi:hypothetical protein [Frankia sp. AgB32]|uniref:hypothetical protein n=1 Tax=Frankia sp. AgB32 TaxID=631119 RepID=UPI00200DB5B4|nr:hypothetical protein [Frankia sp. AgB32]MCK9893537.1 hypothetical protein [Frankia sp. AgB32]